MIRTLTIALPFTLAATLALGACAPQGPPRDGRPPPGDRSLLAPPIAQPGPNTPTPPSRSGY